MQDQPELDGQLPGFPGYLLRQAREEQGISQKEAARDLHLTSKVINALEEDNFESIRSFLLLEGISALMRVIWAWMDRPWWPSLTPFMVCQIIVVNRC